MVFSVNLPHPPNVLKYVSLPYFLVNVVATHYVEEHWVYGTLFYAFEVFCVIFFTTTLHSRNLFMWRHGRVKILLNGSTCSTFTLTRISGHSRSTLCLYVRHNSSCSFKSTVQHKFGFLNRVKQEYKGL